MRTGGGEADGGSRQVWHVLSGSIRRCTCCAGYEVSMRGVYILTTWVRSFSSCAAFCSCASFLHCDGWESG